MQSRLARHWALLAQAWIGLLLLLLVASSTPLQAAAPVVSPTDQPGKIQELLDLLANPQVQDWIKAQAAAAAAAPAEPTATHAGAGNLLSGRLGAIRGHMAALVSIIPQLPAEFARAGDNMAEELQGRSLWGVMALLVAFLGLGFGAEWLFVRATGRLRSWMLGLSAATLGQRLTAMLARLVYGAALVSVFGLASVGAFLVFDWPPLLREILFLFLLAFLELRLALVVSRFFLAPGTAEVEDADRFRILPMSRAAARFWHRRLSILVGWFAFGYATVNLLSELGFDLEARRLVAYILGLGLLAIGFDMVWRHPAAGPAEGASVLWRRRAVAWRLSAYSSFSGCCGLLLPFPSCGCWSCSSPSLGPSRGRGRRSHRYYSPRAAPKRLPPFLPSWPSCCSGACVRSSSSPVHSFLPTNGISTSWR